MEFARPFDGQITWLCPVEDLLDEICAPAPYSINCRTIGKQSADLHPFSIFMGVRNFVFYSEIDNPLAIKDKSLLGSVTVVIASIIVSCLLRRIEANATSNSGGERTSIGCASIPNFSNAKEICEMIAGVRGKRIVKNCQPREFWNNFFQELDTFDIAIRREIVDTRKVPARM